MIALGRAAPEVNTQKKYSPGAYQVFGPELVASRGRSKTERWKAVPHRHRWSDCSARESL
jgi:hypothetical protein